MHYCRDILTYLTASVCSYYIRSIYTAYATSQVPWLAYVVYAFYICIQQATKSIHASYLSDRPTNWGYSPYCTACTCVDHASSNLGTATTQPLSHILSLSFLVSSLCSLLPQVFFTLLSFTPPFFTPVPRQCMSRYPARV
ncbi:hypothetical protein F5B19DRAFT_148237 [Rostrohypoxylon terebratum]|nr:hypothetical protein F5B19DRAFT_148237 [Rostrohypoxylon terebratum]